MLKLDINNCTGSSEKLLAQAELFLKSKIAIEPKNINYLLKLGHILRQKGQLERSLEYFTKILTWYPENLEAKCMEAILNKKPIKHKCRHGLCPTPFMYNKNYLSNDEFQIIWNSMISKRKYFTDSIVADDYKSDKLDTNMRKSLTLSKSNLNDISEWFLEKIVSELPSVWPLMPMKPFDISKIEMELTRHGNNDFFKIHKDSVSKEGIQSRALTFVYYFHKLPKRFKGGEILFFDTDIEQDDFCVQYTKVVPEHNSIVFFPSNFYHQVTPVHLEDDNFEDGRFTIHGWLHN